jgi:hypothetical protein
MESQELSHLLKVIRYLGVLSIEGVEEGEIYRRKSPARNNNAQIRDEPTSLEKGHILVSKTLLHMYYPRARNHNKGRRPRKINKRRKKSLQLSSGRPNYFIEEIISSRCAKLSSFIVSSQSCFINFLPSGLW